MFCTSALLLSLCENHFCLSQLLKALNSMERGAPFRYFCVSKVITTAYAHKSGSFSYIFIFCVGTNVGESKRVKHFESAVRRTSKRERCVKELVNNHHTLERTSKVKKNPHLHHRSFFSSVGGPLKTSTCGVGAGAQAVTAPGAFDFRFQTTQIP